MTDTIKTGIGGGIAAITIDKPEKRNSLDGDDVAALQRACVDAAARNEVAVLLIQGIGGKAFCAGADLASVAGQENFSEMALALARAIDAMTAAVAAIEKPVIAGIDGVCLGAGLQLAAAADIRIASASSRFGIPAIQRGFIASPNGIARLNMMIGPGATKLLLLEGGMWNAREAVAKGLVDRVVETDDFTADINTFARTLAGFDAAALNASKAIVNELAANGNEATAAMHAMHDTILGNDAIKQALGDFRKS